eukprot:gene14191-biopygen13016
MLRMQSRRRELTYSACQSGARCSGKQPSRTKRRPGTHAERIAAGAGASRLEQTAPASGSGAGAGPFAPRAFPGPGRRRCGGGAVGARYGARRRHVPGSRARRPARSAESYGSASFFCRLVTVPYGALED